MILELYIGCINMLKIGIIDMALCYIIGKRARWYQLHCLINTIVVIEIFPTIIDMIINMENGYKNIENNNLSNYIIFLHIYHILTFKNLNKYDYFHHIIFVGLGIIPTLGYIKSSQIYFHKLACSGIPGIIEYGSLTLYKNNLISKYNQKLLNTILYTYIRLPLCIFGITMNYIAYINGYIEDNLIITIYINLLLYLNGTIFTQLTNYSYYKLINDNIEINQ